MAKKINIKPIDILELEFADGTVKKCSFPVSALIEYDSRYGAISNVDDEEIKKNPMLYASRLLHVGMLVHDRTVTVDECEAIVLGGGIELLNEIFNSLLASIGHEDLGDEELKKKVSEDILKLLQM